MKVSSKTADKLIMIIALGWVAVIVMTLFGRGFPAMYVSAVIIAAHFVLGLIHKGEIRRKLIWLPFLGWFITFGIGIIGMQYYAFKFGDSIPSFLIFGMHPSLFFELAFYWIAGIVTISYGLVKNRDVWLSEDDWDEFLKIANS